ncbi:cell wall-active antibiotics response protein LiaF [Tenuibacillus multivorans]|uniref:Lia operon protein LiaF n=1 Tax=Tenuibacillus multivorans TaxID=237069 RepID=A0A1H0A3E7_9BACI|nr:cell wall-active antibiotics response protein LiaF [Tenuibacillus multivorans]GEL78382.1 hypothetical protein TMU01_26170 [Tenuibacillus multivorans]SDN28229.1 lia operon protein LiaF [Tenuibacillus multivorans]
MFAKAFAKLAKWLIAFILIGFGFVLILQNINIISLEISNVVWKSWPIIIVIIGMINFSNYFIPHKFGSWKFGSFLVIWGILLWLGNFDYIDFDFIDVWKLWPLILVYIGTNMLFGRKTVSIYMETSDDDKKKASKVSVNHFDDSGDSWKWDNGVEEDDPSSTNTEGNNKQHKNRKQSGYFKYHLNKKRHFVTDLNFSEDNWEVKDMNLWTGVGDLYFDFSKGYIPNRETKIYLRGYIADIQMKLPENVAYRIHANVNIGDVTIFEKNRSGMGSTLSYESEDYEKATRKVDIMMDYKIGDITVHSV